MPAGARFLQILRRRPPRPQSSAPPPAALADPAPAAAPPEGRTIKVGVVGCGVRGSWIAGLFQKNGGYEVHALADYFQEAVNKCGDALGVDRRRRFTGLSGYKKLLESGVEAVVIIDIPYFYAEQAQAAVDAGCHIYMAKPVATDVPGCLAIKAAGKEATRKKLCFLVDYQMPTDPVNIEVVRRIRDGALGKLLSVSTWGLGGREITEDPLREKTLENVFQGLRWIRDIALGCDWIGNFDVHPIDAAIWATGQVPVAAYGQARICRPNPRGDRHDLFTLIYECPNGMPWVHESFCVPAHERELSCDVRGELASAAINYGGKAYIRGGPKHYSGGNVVDLYVAGPKRNIAAFHQQIIEGRHDNPTVRRAIDGVLTAILGREAGQRGVRLTMDEVLKENKRLTVDLSGLKV